MNYMYPLNLSGNYIYTFDYQYIYFWPSLLRPEQWLVLVPLRPSSYGQLSCPVVTISAMVTPTPSDWPFVGVWLRWPLMRTQRTVYQSAARRLRSSIIDRYTLEESQVGSHSRHGRKLFSGINSCWSSTWSLCTGWKPNISLQPLKLLPGSLTFKTLVQFHLISIL